MPEDKSKEDDGTKKGAPKFAPMADGLLSGATSNEELEQRRKKDDEKGTKAVEINVQPQVEETGDDFIRRDEGDQNKMVATEFSIRSASPRVSKKGTGVVKAPKLDEPRSGTHVVITPNKSPSFIPSAEEEPKPAAEDYAEPILENPNAFKEDAGEDDTWVGESKISDTLLKEHLNEQAAAGTTPDAPDDDPFGGATDYSATQSLRRDDVKEELEKAAGIETSHALDTDESMELDAANAGDVPDAGMSKIDSPIAAQGASWENALYDNSDNRAEASQPTEEIGTTTSSHEIPALALSNDPAAVTAALSAQVATDTEVDAPDKPKTRAEIVDETRRLERVLKENNIASVSPSVPEDALRTDIDADKEATRRLKLLDAQGELAKEDGDEHLAGTAPEEPSPGKAKDTLLESLPAEEKVRLALLKMRYQQKTQFKGATRRAVHAGEKEIVRVSLEGKKDQTKSGAYTAFTHEQKKDAENIRLQNGERTALTAIKAVRKTDLEKRVKTGRRIRNLLVGSIVGGLVATGAYALYDQLKPRETPSVPIVAYTPDNSTSNVNIPSNNTSNTANNNSGVAANNANNAGNASSNVPDNTPSPSVEELIDDYFRNEFNINIRDLKSPEVVYDNKNKLEYLRSSNANQITKNFEFESNGETFKLKPSRRNDVYEALRFGIDPKDKDDKIFLEELVKQVGKLSLVAEQKEEATIEGVENKVEYKVTTEGTNLKLSLRHTTDSEGNLQLQGFISYNPKFTVIYDSKSVDKTLDSLQATTERWFNLPDDFVKAFYADALEKQIPSTPPQVYTKKLIDDYFNEFNFDTGSLTPEIFYNNTKLNFITNNGLNEITTDSPFEHGGKKYKLKEDVFIALNDGINSKDTSLENLLEQFRKLSLTKTKEDEAEIPGVENKVKYTVNVEGTNLNLRLSYNKDDDNNLQLFGDLSYGEKTTLTYGEGKSFDISEAWLPRNSEKFKLPNEFVDAFISDALEEVKPETPEPQVDINELINKLDLEKIIYKNATLKDENKVIKFSDKGEPTQIDNIKFGNVEYYVPDFVKDGVNITDLSEDDNLKPITDYLASLKLEIQDHIIKANNKRNEFKLSFENPDITLKLGELKDSEKTTLYATLQYKGTVNVLDQDNTVVRTKENVKVDLGEIELSKFTNLEEKLKTYFEGRRTNKITQAVQEFAKSPMQVGLKTFEKFVFSLGNQTIPSIWNPEVYTNPDAVSSLIEKVTNNGKEEIKKKVFRLFGADLELPDYFEDGLSIKDLSKDPTLYKVLEELYTARIDYGKPTFEFEDPETKKKIKVPITPQLLDPELKLGLWDGKLIARITYTGKSTIGPDTDYKTEVELEPIKTDWFLLDNAGSLKEELGAHLRNLQYPRAPQRKNVANFEDNVYTQQDFKKDLTTLGAKEIAILNQEQFKNLLEVKLSEKFDIKYGKFVPKHDALFAALFTKEDADEYIAYVNIVQPKGHKKMYQRVIQRLPIRAVDHQFYQLRIKSKNQD